VRKALSRIGCFLACVAVAAPLLAQEVQQVPQPPAPPSSRPADDKPYVAVWLTGEQGRARAGVVFSHQGGKIQIKNDTTVSAPDGKEWDLSNLQGFMNFLLSSSPTFIIVSPDGSLGDSTIGRAINGILPVSLKLDARANLVSGKSKAGTQVTKGKVAGFLGITSDGLVLLPVAGAYSALGTVVTTISGATKSEKTMEINGTVLGFLNGKLTLGLVGSNETGHVTFALPEFVNVANRRGVYRGQVLAMDNFGFAHISEPSEPSTANSVVSPKTAATSCRGGEVWRIAVYMSSSAAVSAEARSYIKNGDDKMTKSDLRGALTDYDQAIQLQPDLEDPYVYSNRAVAKAATGDLEGSIADSTKAIDLSPSFAIAYENRGMAKQMKCDTDGAIEDFAKDFDLAVSKPDKDKAAASLAVNYYRRSAGRADKKDLDGAIEDCTMAIQLAPNYAEAYYSRSSLRQAKGDIAGAKADLAKAIQLKPGLARP